LYTLVIVERLAKIFSKFFALIVFLLLVFFFFLFISLAFVFWYETAFGSRLQGYLIAALFYLIVGVIIYLFRKKLFLNPMIGGLTDTAFEAEDLLDKKHSNANDEKNT